jgi:hypothetical protein
MATQPELYGTGNSESWDNAHSIRPPVEASDIESTDRTFFRALESRSIRTGRLVVSIRHWVIASTWDSPTQQLLSLMKDQYTVCDVMDEINERDFSGFMLLAIDYHQ